MSDKAMVRYRAVRGCQRRITDIQALTEGPGMASTFVRTGGVGSGIMAMPSRVPGPLPPRGHLRRPRRCRRHGSHGTRTRRHHHGALNRPPARRPLVCLAGPARHCPLPDDRSPGGSPTGTLARCTELPCLSTGVTVAMPPLHRVACDRASGAGLDAAGAALLSGVTSTCPDRRIGRERPLSWRRDHARDAASRC